MAVMEALKQQRDRAVKNIGMLKQLKREAWNKPHKFLVDFKRGVRLCVVAGVLTMVVV